MPQRHVTARSVRTLDSASPSLADCYLLTPTSTFHLHRAPPTPASPHLPTIERSFPQPPDLPLLAARQLLSDPRSSLPVVCHSTPSLRIPQGLWRVAARSHGFQLSLRPLRVIELILLQAPVA
ncbi:hypothetical protein EJ02DRAFT_457042 [Clathrospora elynae]|uniref:Uncharacterized protein n=1 Tax=Clathrospora elynae TaxID=706981 RepID=A0A6A5SH05_9PLEO|nr:hypothetical protein EJ02DRAFT_457042 [Clathrospora elynae]